MSTGETDKNVETKPTNPTPPQQPQQPEVIAPTVEDPKPKATKGEEDEDKKKVQPEEPKKTTPKKKEESQEKNPYLALNEDLQKMVADINGSINDALGKVAKAGWDKVSNTELGKAVGGLKDAITAKAEDLGQQLKDKAGEKLDALTDSISNTAVGKAVTQFKDSISSLPDMVSKGLTDAIKGATQSINDSMKPKEEETETMDMQSPKSTKPQDTNNLTDDFNKAFEGMDFEALIEPSKPAPQEKEPDLTKEGPSFTS